MSNAETFDVVVVGGGPSGATAADELAKRGRKVLLLDRDGRIKPCGGAIPPRAIRDYQIPDQMLVAKIRSARMVSPSDKHVDIPIDNGYVGMVDRAEFDEWLRARAESHGATRRTGSFETLTRDADGTALIHYKPRDGLSTSVRTGIGALPATVDAAVVQLGDMPGVGAPLLLLVHGGRDHCRSWDWVAEQLRAENRQLRCDRDARDDYERCLGNAKGDSARGSCFRRSCASSTDTAVCDNDHRIFELHHFFNAGHSQRRRVVTQVARG